MTDYSNETDIERFFRSHKRGTHVFMDSCLAVAGTNGKKPYLVDYWKAIKWCKVQALELMSRNKDFIAFASRFGKDAMSVLPQQMASSVMFWKEYEASKTIFRVDEDLWKDLSNTKFPDAFPIKHLRPPKIGFILDVPIGSHATQRYIMVCVNAYDTSVDTNEDNIALRILEFDNTHAFKIHFDEDGGMLPIMMRSVAVLNLRGETVGDVWKTFEERSSAVGMNSEELVKQFERDKDIVRGVVNLILYMQSPSSKGDCKTLRKLEDFKPSLSKKAKKAEKKNRIVDMLLHTVIDVGFDYGEKAKEWLNENTSEDMLGHGVRPHMRSAHPHLYWTGKGKLIPDVQFLLPIRVGVNK